MGFWKRSLLLISSISAISIVFLFILSNRLIAFDESQIKWVARSSKVSTVHDIPPSLEQRENTQNAHRLAIIVPFRERFTELSRLVPHLAEFLHNQSILFTFYVINQIDNFRFNRGALLNVGVLESLNTESKGIILDFHPQNGMHGFGSSRRYVFPKTDYIALHDVDLLPVDPELSYSFPPETGPVHLIPAKIHPRYNWVKNYFGGVILIRREHFQTVNGFSNSFWGWGWEDDEFRRRVLRSGLSINVPSTVKSGFKAFRVIHNEVAHKRDLKTYSHPEVKKLLFEGQGGMDTLKHVVSSRRLIHFDGIPVLIFDVVLQCTVSPVLCGAQDNATYNDAMYKYIDP